MSINPFRIVLKCNNYCNYKCEYCINDMPYSNEPKKTIDIRLVKFITYNIKKYLFDQDIIISLSGGEPTLISNICDIIKELLTIPNLRAIHIMSNCTGGG